MREKNDTLSGTKDKKKKEKNEVKDKGNDEELVVCSDPVVVMASLEESPCKDDSPDKKEERDIA